MKYVMSDIHGEYDKYIEMLKLIDLKDEDELYILGDVIDRGPAGMKILQDIMMRINVFPVLGNHEYMMSIAVPWLMQEVTEESVKNIDENVLTGLKEWMNVGGSTSISEFYNLSMDERQDILDYLKEFSLYEEVSAGGKDFILVHAGLCNFTEDRPLDDYDLSELIFQKPDYNKVYFKDKYVVNGHTPTRLTFASEQGLLLEEVPQEQWRDEVFIKNKHIAIDCGCAMGGRLACFCMDTFETFYVD